MKMPLRGIATMPRNCMHGSRICGVNTMSAAGYIFRFRFLRSITFGVVAVSLSFLRTMNSYKSSYSCSIPHTLNKLPMLLVTCTPS